MTQARLVFLLCLLASSLAKAEDECDAILRGNVQDVMVYKLGETQSAAFHAHMCSEESKVAGGSSGTSVGASYGGFGATFGQNQSAMSAYRNAMCRDNASANDFQKFVNYATSTVNKNVIAAWSQCKALNAAGISSSTTYSPANAGVTVGLSLNKSRGNAKGYSVRPGAIAGDVSCSGELKAATADTPVVLDSTQKFLTCERNKGFEGEFEVVILTDSGQITRYVPHSAVQITSKEAAELRSRLDESSLLTTPVGSVLPYAGSMPPQGWRIANGDKLSRFDYAELFAVVGEAYTSEASERGSEIFRIPDLRGVFVRGLDVEQKRDLGDGVRILGSFQADSTRMPRTPFSLADKPNDQGLALYGGTAQGQHGTGGHYNPANTVRVIDRLIIVGGDKETRPVNVALNYIIRVK